jgi:UDP-N-acetylmuramoyl-tripeptide--D-alanyl-D-alanine ligase
MITLSLATLTTAIGGELINADTHRHKKISNLVIDSRMIEAGDVFLALKGDNFDGHAFIEQVIKQGCRVVIVEKKIAPALIGDTAQIIVENSHTALGKVGAYVKAQLAPKTVGITGSSGKTTVKEMVAAILSRLGNVLATHGNFNNDIGVPLTLLRLTPEHEFAVIEMGANHQGEIAYSTALVKPDIALINNVAAAHLEGFGSIDGVAIAKGEIFSGLPAEGIAIYQQNSPYINVWQAVLCDKNIQVFSSDSSNAQNSTEPCHVHGCYSSNIEINTQGCARFTLHSNSDKTKGSIDITLSLPGKHNVDNALAAATICLSLGASLADINLALSTMQQVKGRTNIKQLSKTVTLVDDTYNANVDSVKASIDVLTSLPGQQVFILGDMGELGRDAEQCHQDIGVYAHQKKVDTLLTLGELTQYSTNAFNEQKCKTEEKNTLKNKAEHFTALDVLVNALKQKFTVDVFSGEQALSIVVKGSRSAKMEKVITAIQTWFIEKEVSHSKTTLHTYSSKASKQAPSDNNIDHSFIHKNNKKEETS